MVRYDTCQHKDLVVGFHDQSRCCNWPCYLTTKFPPTPSHMVSVKSHSVGSRPMFCRPVGGVVSEQMSMCVNAVSWPIEPDILSPPLLRLTSRKPLWLDLRPVDIKSRWRYNWKSAQVVNSHLVCDPAIQQPPSATVVSAEPFSHGTGTLRCLQKEMATYRHWSVSLWRDPDDVTHCRILSPDKTEWRLISATLCGWRCCFVADQLWFMTRIREEEVECSQ